VARTLKGKGASFAENKGGWHGKAFKKGEEMDKAIVELERQLVPGADAARLAQQIPKPASRPAAAPPPLPIAAPTYALGDQVATREAYGTALARLGAADERVQEEFSRAECRRIFPRKFGAAYRSRFSQMIPAYQAAARARTTTERSAAMARIRSTLDDFPSSNNQKMSGLRVDVALSDPDTGAERWIDVSTVHTTSPSYVKVEYEDAVELAGEPACNPALMDPSPAAAAREKIKRDKYAILIAIAAKQTAEYRRPATPAFAPFVLSDNGEMGPLQTSSMAG
jgi:hypothetical protein